MTTALCLTCGDTKFGALCPCPSCNADSTGDHNLDIAFSDHRIPVADLKKLGKVIESINAQTDDKDIRFWTFISYISKNHDNILSADTPDEIQTSVSDLLSKLDLPTFEIALEDS